MNVVSKLAAIDPSVATREFGSESSNGPDQKAGIYLSHLSDISSIDEDGYGYNFYVARIDVGGNVNPHFHRHGFEPYLVLSGEGYIYIGNVVDEMVIWNAPKSVASGDLIEIQENEVHCLSNPAGSIKPLDFVFACPPAHLVDCDDRNPQGDRIFTMDLKHGTPSFVQ